MVLIPAPEYHWLAETRYNTYSQFGEDGVLQAIFGVIGATNEWCFECGAADGLFFSNTRRLIEDGWQAVLVEAEDDAFNRLVENNAGYGDRVRCVNLMIDTEHRIETILHRFGVPIDIDLMVIDVDGQDYYLFNSIFQYRPRVVMAEFDPEADPDFLPPLGAPGQAGWRAMLKLGAGKFYTHVHTSGCNLIFVRYPLASLLSGAREKFLEDCKKDAA